MKGLEKMDTHRKRADAPHPLQYSRMLGTLAYAKGMDRYTCHDPDMDQIKDIDDNALFSSHVKAWEDGWDASKRIVSEMRAEERCVTPTADFSKNEHRASAPRRSNHRGDR
tara:strand:- start:2440 stop:2772 length:333 start_codon:yes stop_codon:yes gene_type:complete